MERSIKNRLFASKKAVPTFDPGHFLAKSPWGALRLSVKKREDCSSSNTPMAKGLANFCKRNVAPDQAIFHSHSPRTLCLHQKRSSRKRFSQQTQDPNTICATETQLPNIHFLQQTQAPNIIFATSSQLPNIRFLQQTQGGTLFLDQNALPDFFYYHRHTHTHTFSVAETQLSNIVTVQVLGACIWAWVESCAVACLELPRVGYTVIR